MVISDKAWYMWALHVTHIFADKISLVSNWPLKHEIFHFHLTEISVITFNINSQFLKL